MDRRRFTIPVAWPPRPHHAENCRNPFFTAYRTRRSTLDPCPDSSPHGLLSLSQRKPNPLHSFCQMSKICNFVRKKDRRSGGLGVSSRLGCMMLNYDLRKWNGACFEVGCAGCLFRLRGYFGMEDLVWQRGVGSLRLRISFCCLRRRNSTMSGISRRRR